MKNKRLAYIYLTMTTCAWGSLYVVSKFVLGRIPSFTLLFLRYLIAGVVLLFVQRKRNTKKIEKQDYKYIFFIGFVGYFLSIGAQLLGTKLSNASLSSLINSMNPIFMIFFAVLILKEKVTASKVVSVVAAVAGAYIIIGGVNERGQTIGILLSIFSVVTWSLMSVVVKRVTQKYDALAVTTYGILVAMVCSLSVSIYELATTSNIVLFDFTTIISVVYIGLVCTALSHALWNKSLSMIEAGSCSLFYPVQPMVSVLLGWLFLRERINTSFIIGAALIISGILLSIIAGQKNTRHNEQKIA